MPGTVKAVASPTQDSSTAISSVGAGRQASPYACTSTCHRRTQFVYKLFRVLEDTKQEDILSWTPAGDAFCIKDVEKFTKSLLPEMFKHANFASFVRQLNKYDFHKLKGPEDGTTGVRDQTWTFKHRDFHRDRPDALDTIHRKRPTSTRSNIIPPLSAPSSRPNLSPSSNVRNLAPAPIKPSPSLPPLRPLPSLHTNGSPASSCQKCSYTLQDLQYQLSQCRSEVERLSRQLRDTEECMRHIVVASKESSQRPGYIRSSVSSSGSDDINCDEEIYRII